MRETLEEANARVTLDELYTVISLPQINQVYMMFRARLDDLGFGPGTESLEVRLYDEADIPWEQLAFPTVVWALAHFHDSRDKTDFATYSNPTGDLARMWPPRKPTGL
jgi:ADP-ribose pyrophosphatase YjhB (NUDIX family)